MVFGFQNCGLYTNMNNRELAIDTFKNFPPPCGEYGLLFARKNYKPNEEMHKICVEKDEINEDHIKKLKQHFPVLTADHLINRGYPFKIYKWTIVGRETPAEASNKKSNITIKGNDLYRGCLMGAYIPWIHYTAKRRFEKITQFEIKESQVMPPMHMWFKDIEKLEKWFGKYYNRLVVDIMRSEKK